MSILLFTVLCGGGVARGENVREIVGPLEDSIRKLATEGRTPKGRIAWEKENWLVAERAAQKLRSVFQEGKWTSAFSGDYVNWCVRSGQQCRLVSYALRPLILKGIRDRLARSKSEAIRIFLEKTSRFERLRLSAGLSSSAGFHRGKNFVFLDLGAVPENDAAVYFVHEAIHATDSRLQRAERDYAYGKELQLYFQANQKLSDPAQVPPRQMSALRDWLDSGLQRGLLAEWRAWVPTLDIYRQGLREDLWKPIDWIEQMARDQRPGEKTEVFVFRYLDARFTSPTEKIFSVPVVRATLEEIRAEYRSGKRRLE